MKRTITATGSLALLVLFALGAFYAESAPAGGGPNSLFLWTGPLPGLVLVLSDNPQVFHFNDPFTFTCQHFAAHGVISNGKAMTGKEVTLAGQYTSCEDTNMAQPVIVSPVEFLLNADGSLAIVNKPIVLTLPALGCSVKINNGGPNSNIRLILYLNRPKDVLAHVEIKGIVALASVGLCGEVAGENAEILYRGLWLISVDGGTIQWDAK